MIALIVATVAAVVFGLMTGHWVTAIGVVGVAYTLAGLVYLGAYWRTWR